MLQLLMITHSDIMLSLVMSHRLRRDQNSKDVTSADNDETSTDSPSDLLLFVDNRAIAPGQLHHRRQKAPNETILGCLSIQGRPTDKFLLSVTNAHRHCYSIMAQVMSSNI